MEYGGGVEERRGEKTVEGGVNRRGGWMREGEEGPWPVSSPIVTEICRPSGRRGHWGHH